MTPKPAPTSAPTIDHCLCSCHNTEGSEYNACAHCKPMSAPTESEMRAELATHGKTCDCAHKLMCEDREAWLLSQLGRPIRRGPINTPLQRIESELNAANIPKEVWIGTDSVADRVTWLITRNQLNQQNSRSRHTALQQCAEVIEAALISTQSPEWREAAEYALILAGRRQGLKCAPPL